MIKYTIEKHKQMGCYILWKNVKKEHSYGCRCVYQGTKQECKDLLKKLNK